MPELIVDLLKIIQIKQYQRKWGVFLAHGVAKGLRQLVIIGATIEQASQGVRFSDVYGIQQFALTHFQTLL